MCFGIRTSTPIERMKRPPIVQFSTFAINIVVNSPNAITSSGLILAGRQAKDRRAGIEATDAVGGENEEYCGGIAGIPSDRTGMRLAPETDEFAGLGCRNTLRYTGSETSGALGLDQFVTPTIDRVSERCRQCRADPRECTNCCPDDRKTDR